jgi:hypothetical protein
VASEKLFSLNHLLDLSPKAQEATEGRTANGKHVFNGFDTIPLFRSSHYDELSYPIKVPPATRAPKASELTN